MASTWDKQRKQAMQNLFQEVEDEGGITVVAMWQLRDAAGWDKLGVNVVADIAALLDQHGMGTLPTHETLPLSRNSSVRVYSKGSRVGDLVEAVARPSGQGDRVLRAAGTNDADDVLDRIRTLVAAE